MPLVDGEPTIDGNSNLDGLKVLDVSGWAPTADNLAIVTNPCTGEKFEGYDIFAPSISTGQDNDDALNALLAGEADALWIYTDQAEQYSCANAPEMASWDCTLWYVVLRRKRVISHYLSCSFVLYLIPFKT